MVVELELEQELEQGPGMRTGVQVQAHICFRWKVSRRLEVSNAPRVDVVEGSCRSNCHLVGQQRNQHCL